MLSLFLQSDFSGFVCTKEQLTLN